ncbi:MAG TPA: hypothetical protein V6C76_03825 [Drouetiella sp.]
MAKAKPLQGNAAQQAQVQGNIEKTAPLEGSAEQTAPLQGNVDRTAPLQGNVDKTAPLQGNVDRTAPLQGNIDQTAPLRGNIDQTAPLQGNVDRTAPLQGNIDKQGPLNGRVQDQGGAPLNSMKPTYQAIMRIVQFKDKNGKVTAAPPPITRAEIEGARNRGRVDLNQIPVRSDDSGRPPLRSNLDKNSAPSLTDQAARPKRTALTVPQREKEQTQPRLDSSMDPPPSRDIGEVVQRPVRGLMQIPQPPSHEDTIPQHISVPPSTANVLAPPNQNSQLLIPQTKPELAASPQRAEQTKLRIKQRKKESDKSLIKDLAKTAQNHSSAAPATAVDESLLWDRWYANVNALVCQALQRTMPKHGNPAGTNRIKITVYADHRLEADIIVGSNTQFNQAVLEAYRSLNGNGELQFPAGTHRTINSYETAHIQEIPAVTAGFDSTLVRGDVENFVK